MNDLLFYYDHFASRPRGGYDKVNITKDGKIFYVHLSLLNQFLDDYAQHEEQFGLITEGGDLCIHENAGEIVIANSHGSDIISVISKNKLVNKNIKFWFSTNNNTFSIPINNIPLGFWRKINLIPEIKKQEDKINKILMCFNPNNHPNLRYPLLDKYVHDKNVEYLEFPRGKEHNQHIPQETTQAHLHLLSAINSFKYVLCPQSNGLDTNRLWECELLDTVPITSMLPYYRNIRPFLNIMSFDLLNLNTDMIVNGTKTLVNKKYFLLESYWLAQIKHLQEKL